MWGILDGEKITLHHLGCMGLVLAGVYLINMKARKQKQVVSAS
jgi:multidrug transporter EmrE-like cation transporter